MTNLNIYKSKLAGVKSLKEIKQWLIENKKNAISLKENNNKIKSCFDDMGCSCSMNSKEAEFLSLYEQLSEISEIHKLENYAKEELKTYKIIKVNNIEVKQWLIKNEKIAGENLACFLIDYLDYSEYENDIFHLLAYRKVEQKFEIFIQRNDFKNLIEFKELFDELYYIQKIYPEGLKRIQAEIDKLPIYIS